MGSTSDRGSFAPGGQSEGIRRTELLTALSLAIDLGLGQPMEHVLRSAVISSRLARRLGLDEQRRLTTFDTTMVMWIGRQAGSHEQARWFGDDIAVRSAAYAVDWTGLPFRRLLLRHAGRGRSLPRRVPLMASVATAPKAMLTDLAGTHCTSAAVLADHFGLAPAVRDVLRFSFERWDGRGLPAGASGGDIPIEMRIAQIADVVEVHLRERGADGARAVLRDRCGGQFDPEISAVLKESLDELAGDLFSSSGPALAAEEAGDHDTPQSTEQVDEFIAALGDLADLKCVFTRGHSRAVARRVTAAGALMGLPEDDVAVVRRAAHLHAVGRIGVPNQIWERKGSLSPAEWEKVRLYPYLGGRIVNQIPGMRREADLVENHRERLDGSGYPRGVTGAELTPQDRLLAAADSYQTSRESHPHRSALDESAAAARLRQEAGARRLDAEAVEAVLDTTLGGPVPDAPPDGLTERDVDVLWLIAAARSHREIAAALAMSRAAVRDHVEHLRSSVGVSDRIGASVYAARHGLIRT